MDSINEERLQGLIKFYQSDCSSDAKILENAVEEGRAVSMFTTLLRDTELTSDSTAGKLLKLARLFYFLGYCMDYQNGIPFIEIFSAIIDKGERPKVRNAVMSQKIIVDFLFNRGVDLECLEDYIADKELVEFAMDEDNKSTGVLKRIIARKMENMHNTTKEHGFSALEWATIFYYADCTKLLPEGRTVKERCEKFMNKHSINTTFTNFKTKYYTAKRRINKNNDYPIAKLESLIPFIEENYHLAVTKIDKDIAYLKEERADN